EQRAHRAQTIALPGRVLEALLVGGLLHRTLERALDLAVAAGEKGDHTVDPAPVVLATDVADARRFAALDVVVQAGRAAAATRLRALAGAEHEHLAEHLERRANALGVAERP